MKTLKNVTITQKTVKWYLDNLEIYERPNGSYSHEKEIHTWMALAMYGRPVKAKVLWQSPSAPDTYRCVFEGIDCYFETKNGRAI